MLINCVILPCLTFFHFINDSKVLHLLSIFCLSVTSSPFSFLDAGTPECFHTSDLKLASALSQTCQFRSTTRSVREQSAGDDG